MEHSRFKSDKFKTSVVVKDDNAESKGEKPRIWKMKLEYKQDNRSKQTVGFLSNEPECLIYTDCENKLAINQPILDKIAEVTKQLNVVTIAGLYRTGKSYLLTRLAGRYKGFPLGSTIQSTTKGIWAWCLDHPMDVKQKLLLLDTEGLGDIKRGDSNNDNQLFALVTLLSSTVIYNTMGAFDQDALNKLHFIKEMSKYILTSRSSENESTDLDFDLYFPELILTLRDFTLELKIDDVEITSDEYFEDCLTLIPGDDNKTNEYNKPRYYMRKYFKQRKCFVFDQPAKRKQLHGLEKLTDGQLDEDFVKSVREFKEYVHHKCKPVTLLDGTHVTGRMFASLTRSYVSAIRDGAIPCIQTALDSMAKQENEKAVDAALRCYIDGMNEEFTLPTDDETNALTAHIKCKELAFNIFLNSSLLDNGDVYKAKIDRLVEEEYKRIDLKNEALSIEQCTDAIQRLHVSIEAKIIDGSYSRAGGSTMYKDDRENLKKIYFNFVEHLGVNKYKTYVKFCQEWETEETIIYISDKALAEKDKLAEVERLRNEKFRQEEEMYRKESENMKIQIEKNYKQLENEKQRIYERHTKEMAEQQKRYNEMDQKRKDDMNRLRSEQKTYEAYMSQLRNDRRKAEERMDKIQKEHIDEHSTLAQQLSDKRFNNDFPSPYYF